MALRLLFAPSWWWIGVAAGISVLVPWPPSGCSSWNGYRCSEWWRYSSLRAGVGIVGSMVRPELGVTLLGAPRPLCLAAPSLVASWARCWRSKHIASSLAFRLVVYNLRRVCSSPAPSRFFTVSGGFVCFGLGWGWHARLDWLLMLIKPRFEAFTLHIILLASLGTHSGLGMPTACLVRPGHDVRLLLLCAAAAVARGWVSTPCARSGSARGPDLPRRATL